MTAPNRKPARPPLTSREEAEIIRLYLQNTIPVREIGRQFNASTHTIQDVLGRNRIPKKRTSPRTKVDWSDENVQLLKSLWSDKKTIDQIAAQIPGATRNAIIGKIHRLGLGGHCR